MNPDGGPAIPVSVNTDRAIQGGTAIPVYGYASAPTDGRPAQAGAAIPVRVLAAADLVQNGGTWVLEGRYAAMPVYTAPSSSGVIGGPAIAVYPINAWPPSNAVPAWAPTDLAGLALWLKADAGTFKDAAKAQPATVDGDAIYTWADQSGNGRDMTQATAGLRPLLKLNIQNGKPVVLTDGIDDYLASAVFALNQPVTLCIAYAPMSGNRICQGLTANGCVFYFNGTNPAMYSGSPGPFYAGLAGRFDIAVCVFNGASSNLWYNGVLQNSPANVGAVDMGGFVLGTNHLGGEPGSSRYGEIIVSAGVISDANRALVESYLNTRWAVY